MDNNFSPYMLADQSLRAGTVNIGHRHRAAVVSGAIHGPGRPPHGAADAQEDEAPGMNRSTAWSVACGTSCFGDKCAYRELVSTPKICANSPGESTLRGRRIGP